MLKGSYEPYVPIESAKRNKDFAEVLAGVDDISLFEEDNQHVLELAGTIQIDNASNGHISSSQASHGGQAAGMSALLPFVRQYAFSNPNFGNRYRGQSNIKSNTLTRI